MSTGVKGSTVLVTGGAGFVGANLAHRLASQGERVRIYDNLSRPGAERNLVWLKDLHGAALDVHVADVRDPSGLQAAMDNVSTVFHFAAQVAVTTSLVDPRADFDVNARGTLEVLEAVRASRSRPSLIFTSTNKVYGALSDVPLRRGQRRYEPELSDIAEHGISEARPLEFHSPYGCSKGTADQYVLDYARTFDLHAVVFRMSCIYGPRQFGNEDQGWVAHFLLRGMLGEPITLYGDGRQVRDILFVDDLVEAFQLARSAIGELRGRAFNIGGGPENTLSLVELIELIERNVPCLPKLVFESWRTADQRYYVSDIREFSRRTGWRPRMKVQEGIERLARWVGEITARAQGPVAGAPVEAMP